MNPRHRRPSPAQAESRPSPAQDTLSSRRPRRLATVSALSGLAVTAVVLAGLQTLDGSTEVAVADLPTRTTSGDTSPVTRSAARPALTDLSSSAGRLSDLAQDLSAKQAAAEKKAREKAAAERRIRDAIADPRGAARQMLGEFGWGAGQFGCLDSLWSGESGWNYRATNAYSGAYGIPQSLPGSKMATVGSDWQTNPLTQIRWGLGYIRDVYGSPCSAMSAKAGKGWY